MTRLHRATVLMLALMVSASAADVGAAQSSRIGKPRPAPPGPSSLPPLPPAEFDPALNIGGEDVEADKIESRLSVDVRINGQGPYQFIVDSGADTSVVGLKVATALNLPVTTPVILNGMTSRNIVDRVRVDAFTVGSTTIRDLQMPALKESHVGSDGIIGIDALVQQRLLMDFEKRQIKVEDARVPIKTYPGEIVITARRERGQLILTEVRAAGLALEAVIDTGSEITIGNSALRDKLIRRNRDKFMTIPVTGVTGTRVNLQFAKIGELELGPVKLRNVPMAFADVPPFEVFGLSNEPALLLGTDILEQFRRVSLDFRARKIRFQLKSCESKGITLSTDPQSLTRISSTGGSHVCAR